MTTIEGYGFYFSGCSVDCYDRNISYDLSGLRKVFVKTPSIAGDDTRTAKRKGRRGNPAALGTDDTQTYVPELNRLVVKKI